MTKTPFDGDRPESDSGPLESEQARTPLDQWLAEAAAAERSAPPVDSDRFVARLRHRIAPVAPNPFRERPTMARAFAIAAMIPLAIALWLCFGPGEGFGPQGGGSGDETISAEELALIDNLDLLEFLDDLPTDEIAEIDPDLFDLYLQLDVLEELPVEVLGNS